MKNTKRKNTFVTAVYIVAPSLIPVYVLFGDLKQSSEVFKDSFIKIFFYYTFTGLKYIYGDFKFSKSVTQDMSFKRKTLEYYYYYITAQTLLYIEFELVNVKTTQSHLNVSQRI